MDRFPMDFLWIFHGGRRPTKNELLGSVLVKLWSAQTNKYQLCVLCFVLFSRCLCSMLSTNTWAHRYQRWDKYLGAPLSASKATATPTSIHGELLGSHFCRGSHHLELPVELPVIVPWLQPAHMLMPLIPNCIRSLHILQFVSFPRECILAWDS